jgi:heme exporter protein B
MKLFLMIIKRDLLVAYRQRLEFLNPIMFFMLITLLFPLAITSEPERLMVMAPGIIWIAIVFAAILSIDKIFQSDFADGTLEQLLFLPSSFAFIVLSKIVAYWLMTALPLILLACFMSQFFFLPLHALPTLVVSLLLGSPVLIIIGAIGSALTLSLNNRGIILVLIVLPLYLPILIFGSSAVLDACYHLPVQSQLAFLGAFVALSVTFAPMAIASALRLNL